MNTPPLLSILHGGGEGFIICNLHIASLANTKFLFISFKPKGDILKMKIETKRQSCPPLELLMLEGETISQDLQSDQNIIFYREGGDVRG